MYSHRKCSQCSWPQVRDTSTSNQTSPNARGERNMADEKPKMVKVEALQAHTFNGQSYEVGDSYDIDEQYVESVASQG